MSQETMNQANGNGGQATMNNLYARNPEEEIVGTMVPGMQPQSNPSSMPLVPAQAQNNSTTPIVGFMYSISNGGVTEFWTLHLGTNTIGRSSSCDIQLNEASISDMHASLSIKQMKTTGKIIASVRDTGSKNGMFINDEELDYEFHSCQNGDVLTIGFAYKLLLVLINPLEQGLSVAENFTPAKPVAPAPNYAQNNQPEEINKTLSLDDANIDAGATRVM